MDSGKILARLLEKRGIEGKAEIAEFLSSRPKKTYDPFLLRHMEEGVDLLLETFDRGDMICIYGDYDADGVTSVCILKTVLSRLTHEDIPYYIPSRFDEGYGLNKEAIQRMANMGAKLIITVDCGSSSHEEVEFAKKLGMDVIVTDHHHVGETVPPCILINPKQEGCSYPFKDLAGCGVAFKLAQAIVRERRLEKKVLNSCLDLVAIGTIGDIVPLLDENRTMVKYGLEMINQRSRAGLRVLIEKVFSKKEKLNSEDVAYSIVPHINAAGRMDQGSIGVEMLLCGEEEKCENLAMQLVEYNDERKRIQRETTEECLRLVDEQCSDSPFPIVKAANAHEGIIGIVAGKLKDELERPVAIVTPSGDILKGSARSIPGIDVFHLMDAHRDLMEKLGGHQGACGFSIREENLDLLRRNLRDDILQMQADAWPEELLQENMFDMVLAEEEITIELARAIEGMEPFGEQNPRPTFLVEGIRLSRQKKLGETGSHCRFTANFPGGSQMECILFGQGDKYEALIFGKHPLDMRGKLKVSRWQGVEEIQMTVEELFEVKIHEH